MTEMTVQEASSIVSKCAHEYRAFKKLEEALKVVESVEQLGDEAQLRKNNRLEQVRGLQDQLTDLEDGVKKEESKRESVVAETGRLKTEAQADLQKVRARNEKEVKEIEDNFANRVKYLNNSIEEKESQVRNEIAAKEEELKTITDKIEKANTELNSIKERLG